MRLLDRFVALLLLGALLASCAPTQEGQEEGSEIADLPRFIDLGSDQCTPCKEMAPILEQLKHDYAGIVDIEFIDVRKDAAAGMVHAVRIIPTQIFMDRSGSEIFRHEGFFSREEIVAILRDSLGVAVIPAPEDSVGTEEDEDEFYIEGTM